MLRQNRNLCPSEIYGRSIPTQKVGGDLLDVYVGEKDLTCFIADISGHGVAAGLMMGMFKTSMHINLQNNLPITTILNQANKYFITSKSVLCFDLRVHSLFCKPYCGILHSRSFAYSPFQSARKSD